MENRTIAFFEENDKEYHPQDRKYLQTERKKAQIMEKLDHIKSKLQLSKIYHKIVKMSQKLREDICSTYNGPVSRVESHGCGCRKSNGKGREPVVGGTKRESRR